MLLGDLVLGDVVVMVYLGVLGNLFGDFGFGDSVGLGFVSVWGFVCFMIIFEDFCFGGFCFGGGGEELIFMIV